MKRATDNSKISGLSRCKEGVATNCFYLRWTDGRRNVGGKVGRWSGTQSLDVYQTSTQTQEAALAVQCQVWGITRHRRN